MRGSIMKGLICVVCNLLFINLANATDTTASWHITDTREVYRIQFDVKVYKVPNDIVNEEHFNNAAIQSVEYYDAGANGIYKVKLNSTANKNTNEHIAELDRLYGGTQLLALTRINGANYEDELGTIIDNQLFISFSRKVTAAEALAFGNKHGLILVNTEVLNMAGGADKVYLYKHMNRVDAYTLANKSMQIYEAEAGFVTVAHPNRVTMFQPNNLNDVHLSRSWHLDNTGSPLFCNNQSGTVGADIGATDVWNMGYTGQGIKVAVIDFTGFDYDHPDMQGQMLPGWDCVNNTSYDASNYHYVGDSKSHGMAVAGIIGAKGNNNEGSAGVAHGAKIIPLLIDGSEASVVLALQKALEMDADVINMSFGSYNPSGAMKTQIDNLTSVGRNRWGKAYGTVIVASHGNDAFNDKTKPQYPSAYESVISVGASTPDDTYKTSGDNWNTGTAWGTNYGKNLHLTAPGVCIFTTDVSGSEGYSTQDYIGFNKTSAAAPIVAGSAALVLSKNDLMTYQEVIDLLTSSADKTGSYNYDVDPAKPGLSEEMGYGRVNVMKAIGETAVGINDQEVFEGAFSITNPVQNNLTMNYSMGDNEQYSIAIFDLAGKRMVESELNTMNNSMILDVNNLLPGMYVTSLIRGGEAVVTSKKFIKLQ